MVPPLTKPEHPSPSAEGLFRSQASTTPLTVRSHQLDQSLVLAVLTEIPSYALAVIGVSFDENPSSLSDFNTTSSGKNYPLLLPTFSTPVEGSFCVQVNVSSLNVANVTNGTEATILMVFNGGDGTLHQVNINRLT